LTEHFVTAYIRRRFGGNGVALEEDASEEDALIVLIPEFTQQTQDHSQTLFPELVAIRKEQQCRQEESLQQQQLMHGIEKNSGC